MGLYLYMVGVGGALFSRLHSAGTRRKNTTIIINLQSDQCSVEKDDKIRDALFDRCSF